jgi:Protein O-mannosyl-transferase TMEM260-like
MDFKKLNNYLGWGVFLIATIVYAWTIEPTTSLWDCGEYITTSYKLEVGHPPGAPLYMMMGRLFSMFASPENAAMMINLMSAIASSFTILFLFWTISLIAKKVSIYPEVSIFGKKDEIVDVEEKPAEKREMTDGYKWAILGSALIGSLAYTFTDTFWFSAVEGEVYAMSSFFTAIVFWAIFKWDSELQDKVDSPDDEEIQGKREDRWLIFIFFMIGLSIGVHLLNLLCIPAIAYVIYFRKFKSITPMGFILTGVIGVVTLGIIQSVLIPKSVALAGWMERQFVNGLGLPFNSGTVFFFMFVTAIFVALLLISRKSAKPILNTVVWSAAMIFIGYSCFAMIVIRSNANTPLDENDPENLVSLQSYLEREQYGDWPVLYGQYFTAEPVKDRKQWKDRNDVYLRRFVVVSSTGKEIKGFKTEKEAKEFAVGKGKISIVEKYFKTFDGTNMKPKYDPEHSTIFPRMWSSDQRHINGYQSWSGHKGGRKPSMGENLNYFISYQINWMYWRYFMWNFSGRQSDEQGHGSPRDGNWISGVNLIDRTHVGDQSVVPGFISNNPSHNKFYMFPLILGLIGFIFMITKSTKSWWIVMLLFLLTGFAIIIYLNQKPFEPRERDYAYAASFYAFSIFIGFSVLGLYDAYKNMSWKQMGILKSVLGGVVTFLLIGSLAAGLSMAYMMVVMGALYAAFILMRGRIKKDATAAVMATLMLLPVPVIMATQGWDDHDRSGRYTAQALAYNYLMSCEDNAIVYTNGDNDTFPLWYLQEVEGTKTSVRVCNLSLLNTDWYSEQMTKKAYDSEPLPISFTEEQYRQNGSRDYMYVLGTNELTMSSGAISDKWTKILDIKIASNPELFKPAFKTACLSLTSILAPSLFPQKQEQLFAALPTFDSSNTYYEFRNLCFQLMEKYPEYGLDVNAAQNIQNLLVTFNDAFDYLPADIAMAFLADDSNAEDRGLFILPSKGLTINVDKDKVLANGIVDEKDSDRIVEKMSWKIPKSTIFKADLMVLDMVAHFNWERPIYFASSASSATYLGLTKYFFAEGLVYKLVPIEVKRNRNPNSLGEVNKPRMYENLMNTFEWGNMNVEGVLVDYYTRRLTNNYRVQFAVLADAYVEEMDQAKQRIDICNQVLAQTGPEDQVFPTPFGDITKADCPRITKEAQVSLDENPALITAVLNKSFEVMPEFNVPFGRVMPSYVSAYFAAGDEENGKKYCDRTLEVFEEDINYYLSVDPEFSSQMIQDMFDSYRGVFSLYQAVSLHCTDVLYQQTVSDKFVAITKNVKKGLNPIKKESASARKLILGTFDQFFLSYQDLYISLGVL